MATQNSPINFGIIGCAKIARKLSRAILLSQNATLSAVGSRSIETAKKFATENNFPATAKVYGTYEEVLDDPNVDAVYMPLPTSLHLKWAVLAAQKKKHVLLEKPVALNVKELDMMIEACESNGVQFMDGTMWMHHPRAAKMKEFLADSDQFGQLKAVHTNFTFGATQEFLETDIRVKPDLDALGALGDVGWYCARGILWTADFELPKLATAMRNPLFNKAGVITSCGATLAWEDGKVASFHCSFLSDYTMDLTAFGSKGALHLSDFIIPYEEKQASFTTSTGTKLAHLETGWTPKPSEHVVVTDIPQDVHMITEFARLVAGIKYEGAKPEKKWPTFSRKTQAVLDAVKASINNGFEAVPVSN